MHCTYFGDLHLCKDSCQDKLAEGCEEEEAPVEAKDVDHLGAKKNFISKSFHKNYFSMNPKISIIQKDYSLDPHRCKVPVPIHFSTHTFISPPNQPSLQTCIQE